LGPRYALELGYSQSLVRAGEFPNTEAFSAALAVRLPYGFTIAPGMWADLKDDPVYGGALALRFSAPVHGRSAAGSGIPHAITLPRLSGAVLVPPPLAEFPLADADELWRSIRQEMSPVFDDVMALPSLDVPGLPYRDDARAEQESSIRAIAAAHPEADWLLISRVEREDVSRHSGMTIPLVVSQPQWVAECRLRIELVSLKQTRAPIRQVIEGRAVKRESPTLSMISSPESNVLSMSDGRELTFQAYRQAGREIAREVSRAQ